MSLKITKFEEDHRNFNMKNKRKMFIKRLSLPGFITSSSLLKETLFRLRDEETRLASSIGKVDIRRLCAVLYSVKS